MTDNMTGFEARPEDGAVNIYQNDMADEFPVLKAFQQYIDAEHAKARKRLVLLCVFFSFVMTVVISVFVGLLIVSSSRMQALNDRMFEYATKVHTERAPVSVTPAPQQQPAPQQDDPALRLLTSKLESLEKKLSEERSRSETAVVVPPKAETRSSREEIEIERLKALLAIEKEKASADREKLRKAELEAYRREHYPELYSPKPKNQAPAKSHSRKSRLAEEEAEADREIKDILKDLEPVEYFEYEDEDDSGQKALSRNKRTSAPPQKKDVAPSRDDAAANDEIKDASGNAWQIPDDE